MGKLSKFENVDVIASLEAIMKQNTAFYQSDFDIDKQILRKAAVSLIPEDKRLLWFSRPSGTCCFRERDVLLKDTQAYNTWKFCGEQTHDRILAYAVELTGATNGTVQGICMNWTISSTSSIPGCRSACGCQSPDLRKWDAGNWPQRAFQQPLGQIFWRVRAV